MDTLNIHSSTSLVNSIACKDMLYPLLKLNPQPQCILASSMQCNTIIDITDIAYQQIESHYYWAQYGDFKVIMDKSTGYINATQLCGQATSKDGERKLFKNWVQNKSSTSLTDEVSKLAGIPSGSLLVVLNKISEILKGTYAHPDLIPHIAAWASPVFAVKVSKIVNAQLVREYRETIRAKDTKIDDLQRTFSVIKAQNDEQTQQIKEQTTCMAEQSKQIKEQTARMDEQSKQINELLTEARTSRAETQAARVEVKQVHEQLTADIEDLNINNAELKTEVHSIAVRLDKATDDRVPKLTDDKRNEALVVYHKPGTNQYKVARRQKKSLKEAAKYYADQQFTARVYCSDSPNAVSLYLLFAKILPSHIGRVYKCTVTLNQGKTTKDLVDFIRKAEAEKKNI